MEGWAEFLREMKNYYNVSAPKGSWGLDVVPAASPTSCCFATISPRMELI